MKKLLLVLLVMVCTAAVLAACSSEEETQQQVEEISVWASVVFDEDDTDMTFEYNGSPIYIDYVFEATDDCSMGLMLIVNGIIHPYKVTNSDTTMHIVDLKANEQSYFNIEFEPLFGAEGEELRIIFANVYTPVIREFSGNAIDFGHTQKISQSMPWIVKMNAEANENNMPAVTPVGSKKNMTKEMVESYQREDGNGNTQDMLDMIHLQVSTQGQLIDNELIPQKDDELNIELFSNAAGKYRLCVLGDMKPISLSGTIYFEAEVEKSKITLFDIPFTAEELKGIKNLFVLATSIDTDDGAVQSPVVYIHNN